MQISLVFLATLGAASALSSEDLPYSQPAWYDEIKAIADASGENMKRCYKVVFGQKEHEKCALREKVCYFGTQECGIAPNVTAYPISKCTCANQTWACDQVKCPNAIDTIPLPPPTDPFPELNGTGTLVAPSASALATLQSVDAAIRQTIADKPDLAAAYVRMGFHDCAPNFPGGGGCDGCVNMAMVPDPITGIMGPEAFSNNGVDKAVYPLEPIVALYETAEVSRADIWAYAVVVSIDATQDDMPFLDGFKVGRRNCETRGLCRLNSTDPAFCSINGMELESELTGADIDFHELMAWFGDHYPLMSNNDVVALLGAHTLGQVNRNNSGYLGQWVANNTVTDNDYYKQLIGDSLTSGPDFRIFNILPDEVFDADSEFQWNQNVLATGVDGSVEELMMLNVDVALVRDLSGGYVPAEHAYKFCNYKSPGNTGCPLAPTLPQAEAYAANNTLWLTDFKKVIDMMISKNP